MSRVLVILALLVAAAPLALGQTPQGTTQGTAGQAAAGQQGGADEQAVVARMAAYLAALQKGDPAAIGEFFADDYTFTAATGQVMTKAERLASLKGTPPPATLAFNQLKVRTYGEVAVVTGHVTSQAGPNGQAINNRTMWVWVRQGGAWRLVAAQNTNVAAGATTP